MICRASAFAPIFFPAGYPVPPVPACAAPVNCCRWGPFDPKAPVKILHGFHQRGGVGRYSDEGDPSPGASPGSASLSGKEKTKSRCPPTASRDRLSAVRSTIVVGQHVEMGPPSHTVEASSPTLYGVGGDHATGPGCEHGSGSGEAATLGAAWTDQRLVARARGYGRLYRSPGSPHYPLYLPSTVCGSEAEAELHLLCPVRALAMYVNRSRGAMLKGGRGQTGGEHGSDAEIEAHGDPIELE
ncbi:unnamed protein product [Boreogadus saida]